MELKYVSPSHRYRVGSAQDTSQGGAKNAPPPNVCALLVPWVGLQCDKLNPGGDTKLHKEVKTFLLLESFSSENPRKM